MSREFKERGDWLFLKDEISAGLHAGPSLIEVSCNSRGNYWDDTPPTVTVDASHAHALGTWLIDCAGQLTLPPSDKWTPGPHPDRISSEINGGIARVFLSIDQRP